MSEYVLECDALALSDLRRGEVEEKRLAGDLGVRRCSVMVAGHAFVWLRWATLAACELDM
jgi:hypothetical protein